MLPPSYKSSCQTKHSEWGREWQQGMYSLKVTSVTTPNDVPAPLSPGNSSLFSSSLMLICTARPGNDVPGRAEGTCSRWAVLCDETSCCLLLLQHRQRSCEHAPLPQLGPGTSPCKLTMTQPAYGEPNVAVDSQGALRAAQATLAGHAEPDSLVHYTSVWHGAASTDRARLAPDQQPYLDSTHSSLMLWQVFMHQCVCPPTARFIRYPVGKTCGGMKHRWAHLSAIGQHHLSSKDAITAQAVLPHGHADPSSQRQALQQQRFS